MERVLSFTERFMRRIMRIFKEEANGERILIRGLRSLETDHER